MSARTPERLYHLLPAVYRQRDFHHGEPLRALLGVMETELRAIEDDVEGLYENWFVETCEEWVVPYLADLLGVRGLEDARSSVVSQRARVANTLGYRRRKGTLAALETLVRDATGWPARAVEYFELLAATQHLEHLRPGKGGLFDLKAVRNPRPLVGPFATTPHNVDVRSIAAGKGRHNLGHLGLFLWRLGSFGLSGCPAKKIAPGCYTFHPLGRDIPLFTRPRPEGEIARAAEAGLPGPIRPSAFAADLARRATDSAFYGAGRSLEIGKVPAADVDVGDLDGWPRPPAGRVTVDVTRGRLAFAEDEEPGEGVEVSYHYGFSAPLGGGPYDRHAGLSDPRGFDWQARLAKGGSMKTLQTARDAWHGLLDEWHEARPPRGLIRIADSATYGGALQLDLPAGSTLAIEAEDGVRPCLRLVGRLEIAGPADGRAQLILDGLLVEGGLHLAGDVDLRLRHSTLLAGEAISAEDGSNVEVTLDHSIVAGAVQLPAEARQLTVRDSLVGRPASPAIAALDGQAGPPATFERATVFGSAFVRQLTRASESIFVGKVVAERRQTGCVRFCYLPEGSVTPRRFRCVPAESKPRFTSVDYGDPAFAQLAADCPKEIRAGAEDGSELGAFHGLQQAQRTSNLQRVLDEYLPLDLEAGVFYVT